MEAQGGIRILVVDRSAEVRGEVGAQLATRGWSVLADAGGDTLGSLLRVFEPEFVVAELVGEEPAAFVERVRTTHDVPVILTLPEASDPHVRTEALRAGVDDILPKPFEVGELVERIHAVLRHHGTPTTLQFDDVRIDEIGHTVARAGNELELTVTEFNLLVAFLRNPGRVMSKRQLLSTVWGFDDYDVNLVEVHVCALRRKLEAFGPRVIQTVRGIGYVLRHHGAGLRRDPRYGRDVLSVAGA